jgi:sulfite reductase alpha subunit-like flavoprotein
MPLDLTILVGTMTGNAQSVAQTLELVLDDGDTNITVLPMDGLEAGVFTSGKLFLICTSTYGQGDVPDNAKALYESLGTDRPNLAEIQYGVIALGDRTYTDTFCNGGKRFDAVMTELGARRIGDVLCHDASSGTMPEEVAEEWIGVWIAAARERAQVTA